MSELDNNLDDIESESFQKKHNAEVIAGVKYAESKGYGFNNFKKFIGQHLNRRMSESQWVFDYESFVCMIHPKYEIDLNAWAKEFYENDWVEECNHEYEATGRHSETCVKCGFTLSGYGYGNG